MRTISNSDDLIDSRDVIARIEELTQERADLVSEAEDDTNAVAEEARDTLRAWDADNLDELTALRELASQTEGYAPDWSHGEALIRDSYFEDYARELAEDIGAIPADAGWPARCIDWEQAADELKQDYTSVEFDGVTYWIRS